MYLKAYIQNLIKMSKWFLSKAYFNIYDEMDVMSFLFCISLVVFLFFSYFFTKAKWLNRVVEFVVMVADVSASTLLSSCDLAYITVMRCTFTYGR